MPGASAREDASRAREARPGFAVAANAGGARAIVCRSAKCAARARVLAGSREARRAHLRLELLDRLRAHVERTELTRRARAPGVCAARSGRAAREGRRDYCFFPRDWGKRGARGRRARALPPVYPRWVPSWDALIGRGARESPPAGKSETRHRTGIDGSRLEKFRASREEEPKKRPCQTSVWVFARNGFRCILPLAFAFPDRPPRAFAHTLAARPRAADATGPPTLGARPRLRERGAGLEPSALPRPRRCRAISRASTRRRPSRPSRSDRTGSAGTGSRR